MADIHQFPAQEEDGLPLNIEAEQAVLGAVLSDQSALARLGSAGGADLFSDPVHQAIYKRAAEMDRAEMRVSPVTMKGWADAHEGLKEIDGAKYLVRLMGAGVGSSAFPSYVELLADIAAKRSLTVAMDAARRAIREGHEPSEVIAGRLEASLIERQTVGRGPAPVSMTSAVTKAVEESMAAYHGETGGRVPSGIHALDHYIGGFYPGEMTLIGGRPSMGKTALSLSIALNVARRGEGVVIASLEMNPEALALRALSESTARLGDGITYANMRRGAMVQGQEETFKRAAYEVAQLPIQFLSRQYADVGALFAGAKQAQRILGPDNMRLLIIDYAQLLRSEARSRYEQITEISMALKALSGALNVPVIALSQLSRQLEQREDKRPMMSDLRESGQLEQDADAVLFCYRDEYYLEREKPDDAGEDLIDWQCQMDRARNRLEIIVAKQRQGEIGTARVRCNPALNLIWED